MILTRINQNNPERIFIAAYNSYAAASLTNGQCVRWDYTTDKDGVGVERCAGENDGFAVAGVVAETIAAGAYGLIQIYGYHSAIRVRTMTETGHDFHQNREAVAAGVSLAYDITQDVFCAEGINEAAVGAGFNLHPFAFALAANAEFTTAAIAGFIKAM